MATPLTDLGSAQYLGFAGGLYPEGKNSLPRDYLLGGTALGAQVQALDTNGRASDAGRTVMLSLGMSNTSREFTEFIRLVDANARKNPRLLLIDAALDGAAATEMAVPFGEYWKFVDQRLEQSGISKAQVQVIWLKTALARETRGFPDHALLLQRTLRSIVGILSNKFPNVKLVYLSSRTYGGYSKTDLSPELIAYESGFAVKWLIEERIKSWNPDRPAPWISWGPYLWADGLNPRSDGVIWELDDFEPDGVHTSEKGAAKVANILLDFFQQEVTAKPWFFTRDQMRGFQK